MAASLRIGVLLSGSGTNFRAIAAACHNGAIDGQVVFVGSDNPRAKGLDYGRRCGIPVFTVDYRSVIRRVCDGTIPTGPSDFVLDDVQAKQSLMPAHSDPGKLKSFLISRAAAEAQLLEKMAAYPFDLLVLAGFMRTLTPYFLDRVNVAPRQLRVMNIHPALLPAFPGVDGYGDTFRYGCKVAGCTVHFVDYGEDTGPIIAQRAFPIRETDTLESIRKRGLQLEWQLYPACIQLFAEGRLRLVRTRLQPPVGQQTSRTVVRIAPDGQTQAP